MDRQEALEVLRAGGSQRERLAAARLMAELADEEDLPVLYTAMRGERVPWIRAALETATARAAVPHDVVPARDQVAVPLASDDAFASEVWARATQELTDRVVHELRPLLGLARLHASREIDGFTSSKTAAALDQMRAVLGAVDTLGKAAAAPRIVEVDLSETIATAVATSAEELSATGLRVHDPRLDGPSPLVTHTDAELVSMALRNGVRNALEASDSVEEPVTVTWGQSSTDVWVTVLDFGAGFLGDDAALFAIGSSTKQSHLGMGLAIAERAMATLGGEVRLIADAQGPTRFELQFPRIGQ